MQILRLIKDISEIPNVKFSSPDVKLNMERMDLTSS